MGDYETIWAVVHKTFSENHYSVAMIRSSLELVDGEIVSFYATFPWGRDGTGKIVIVTAKSIIKSEIELPVEWDHRENGIDVYKPILGSIRVPIKSVVEVKIDSPLRYWEAIPEDRDLAGVSVTVTTSNKAEIEVITSSKFTSDNPKQNLREVLKVLEF